MGSVCSKLEQASSKINKILEINVLHECSLQALLKISLRQILVVAGSQASLKIGSHDTFINNIILLALFQLIEMLICVNNFI